MENLIFKSPKSGAKNNVEDFISFCKNKITVYGDNFDWNSNVWKGFYTFRKLDAVARKLTIQDVFNSEFLDFAKAYIIYHQSFGNKKKLKEEMIALRLIEKSLIQLTAKANIIYCNNRVFDNAIKLSKEKYKKSVVAKAGKALERLSSFLVENSFIEDSFLSWVNPIRFNSRKDIQNIEEIVGKGGKLSDLKAMEALASIFAKPDYSLNQRDIFTTSVFALLMCAPSRISEILSLSSDCEYYEKDSDGVVRYGLRFYSLKGYGADIKWIPTIMVPVAKLAIQRLKKLSLQARSLAKWYETKGNVIFRTPTCPDYDVDRLLTVVEVCQALGYDMSNRDQCKDKLRRLVLNKEGKKLINYDFYYSLKTLWKEIYSVRPEGFPFYDDHLKVKYSNALCLLTENMFHQNRKEHKWKLYKPTYNFFKADLVKDCSNESSRTIFERHGFYDEENEHLSLHTHQPRHFLNTLARLGGMSELNIAKWSGRDNVNHNQNYNHVSKEHLQFFIESMDIQKINQQKLKITNFNVVGKASSLNINDLNHGAYLLSDIGYCQHNYAITPCSKYPGMNDDKRKSSLQEIIDKLILVNYKDKENCVYGAMKWLDHNLIHLQCFNKK